MAPYYANCRDKYFLPETNKNPSLDMSDHVFDKWRECLSAIPNIKEETLAYGVSNALYAILDVNIFLDIVIILFGPLLSIAFILIVTPTVVLLSKRTLRFLARWVPALVVGYWRWLNSVNTR
jgi:hypothetical protein